MVLSHILQDHNPWFLILAVLICLIGASAGIRLWNRALHAPGRSRVDWGFLSSVVLGATIWTTHFVAMLGYSGSIGASFNFELTAISVAVAVFGVACAIGLTIFLRGIVSHLLSGAVLGISISVMHFTGMMGFDPGCGITWGDLWAPDAVLIGVAFGIAMVRLLDFDGGMRPNGRAANVAFTAAVAGVHFTAMAVFHERMSPFFDPAGTGGHAAMAIAVSLVTFILIGVGTSSHLVQARLSNSAAAQLKKSARTDALTGIANREGFNGYLRRRCKDLYAEGQGFALFFVDLDRFKPVNDVFGHAIGDEILRRVVGRLKSIVGPKGHIARLGGDEFCVVLRNVEPGDPEIDRIAACIIDVLTRPFLIDTRVIEIGASAGIATPQPYDDVDPDMLCRNADMALCAAKTEGRGTFLHFELEIAQQFEERRRLEYDLRRAIARNEFELYYQPVVDCVSGAFVGAEALLRWQHPTRGLLAPDVFIPLSEELGLVMQIGKWVIENATQTAVGWSKPLKVSVNVSPMQLRDPRIIRTVRDALQKSGLPAARLDLEITESALLNNEEKGIEILGCLREIGVSISLDDFGTGFSSLSYLHRFPLDRIKIDRSFVKSAQFDPKSARIVEAISNLGTVLGLGVTAEGVETEDQLLMASDNGCDIIQGYLISRPIPTDTFNDLIAGYGFDRDNKGMTGT